jgi:Siphovirus Gp157
LKGFEMATITTTTAENSSLFEIDKELEAAFDAAAEEQERTGTLSDETRQRCTDLFGELGKKVDRIARYVRAMELKARAAKEEATRLAARQKNAENRVEQVKNMLSFFMQSRGLKRLEGELNTIRLQKNGQASLQLNPLEVPGEYNQTAFTLMHQDWVRVLDSVVTPELKQLLESAVTKIEPNKDLIRQQLQAGREIVGATLIKGEHVRFE